MARVWSNTNTVRQFFGQSIQYSMTALTSWVTELNDPNLVLILLGDEQPHSTVSGPDPDNYVPISIVTRAPSVLKQISSWHWQNGLLPDPSAPFEEMDAFRNQFLNTFSTGPARAATPGESRPVSQGRWLVSLTRWTAANPRPCHWISLMQAEPRYSR